MCIRDRIREILKIRAKEEKVELSEEALEKLTEIGAKTSLRYSVQLLSLSAQKAKIAGRGRVEVGDVQVVDDLFMDVGEAMEYLKKYEEKLLKH